MRGTCSNANDPPQDKPSEQSIRCGCSNEEKCECSRRMSSAGHFIKHHPSESQGPQLNNADVGLLANVESERVNDHLLSFLTSSSSFQRSHQASKTTSQVSNKAECTSSIVNCNSSRRLIVRRNSNPNSGATIRGLTSFIFNTPNLINSGTCTTLLFGSTPLRQFSLSQGLFGVPSNLFQSVVSGTRLPHLNGDSTSQLEEAPASFDDSGFPSENQIIDIWRQLLTESTLYIHRPADNNLLEGSSSVFRVTADNGSVDFRLVTENAEVVNQSLRYFSIEMRNRFGGMRLDVDNMSYEELLALEDHIGYVSTGLSEEAAVASLKRSNYFLLADENAQKEFCSICQEDFIEEDELGTLNCGHSFHICCIKQWLGYKNVCPICKSPGLSSTTFSNI